MVRPRRSRRPRSRRPLGRPGRRDVEHRVELRAWLGAASARRLQGRARRRTDPLLPAALGTRLAAGRPAGGVGWAAAREGAAGPAGRTESASGQAHDDAGQQDRLQPSRNAGPGCVRRRAMSQLPARPDPDQLRRQARELHRAALGGDADALRRLRQVSGNAGLSAAQLVIAREYGFASWPRLKAEVERRRAQVDRADEESAPVAEPGPAAAPPLKSWREMREWAASMLLTRTGQDVTAWNRRVAAAGLADEQALRAWLDSQGVTGYGQAMLVWERFGYPDFLTADAEELIAGQYADRPQLRPVLDAVLAALPAAGPATVQARKTFVSLVTPRRTFAVVQATTESRVDLGLRLDQENPGGRLLPARDLGAATVRIPLTRPEDVDAEVLGWLRRAYRENAAPPAPRRLPRRPAPVIGQLTVVIDGFDLPGLTCAPEPGGQVHHNIHVALAGPRKDGRGRGENRPALVIPGNPWLATEPVPGDSPSARWEVPVTVRRDSDGLYFGGPFVRGDRTDRHLGLAWGDVPGDGTLRLFRGAKLRLVDVDPRLIEEALRPQHRLVARIRLTDPRGNPVCARVHPPALTWSAEPTHPQPG